MNHPNQQHCWFTEQQTKHTWCHLCGQHKPAEAIEDDVFDKSKRVLEDAIKAARPIVNVTNVTRTTTYRNRYDR